MTPLAEETIARRARLGMPLTPNARVARCMVPAAPVVRSAPVAMPARNTAPVISVKASPIRRAHWSQILREVAERHNVDARSLLGEARFTHIVLARNEAFWRIRHEVTVLGAPMTLPQIGKRFGKDHSSVLHGIRKHQALLDALAAEKRKPDQFVDKPVNPIGTKRVACGADSMVRDSRPLFRNEAV